MAFLKIILILLFLSGCAIKDYNLNPWTTIMNQLIKVQHGTDNTK
jgi:hypothetical protein|tara:strand:- start:1723 stop:1857 length:135 start_codon:yes stop_codon:yes gene_type:complete